MRFCYWCSVMIPYASCFSAWLGIYLCVFSLFIVPTGIALLSLAASQEKSFRFHCSQRPRCLVIFRSVHLQCVRIAEDLMFFFFTFFSSWLRNCLLFHQDARRFQNLSGHRFPWGWDVHAQQPRTLSRRGLGRRGFSRRVHTLSAQHIWYVEFRSFFNFEFCLADG